ncbi:MAG: hypothetical protein A2Y50_01190 [Pseudomonadales bacterium RIFCSPLOWO2_12_59_9]|nr:MAG: hypothetical protein A2Y50_01190 [Pseudomonadales bacterium RIFCSPLOWO2_12_59_9]
MGLRLIRWANLQARMISATQRTDQRFSIRGFAFLTPRGYHPQPLKTAFSSAYCQESVHHR